MSARPELAGQRYFPKPAVAARYSRSTKSIDRWVAADVFPAADLEIRGRKYWSEEVLDQHDRSHATEQARQQGAAPEHPQP